MASVPFGWSATKAVPNPGRVALIRLGACPSAALIASLIFLTAGCTASFDATSPQARGVADRFAMGVASDNWTSVGPLTDGSPGVTKVSEEAHSFIVKEQVRIRLNPVIDS